MRISDWSSDVCSSDLFVGLLGGRVHAHRVVDAVLDRERQLAVVAVDRARRGVDQVLDAVVAAGLEDVHEADDVGVDVGVRVLERVAYAGLGGEVDHPLRLERSEEHTSEIQSLMRRSFAVFCLKKKKKQKQR